MNVYNGGIIDDEKAKFLNDWKCALDKIKEMVKRLQAKRINKSPSSIDPLTDLNASVSEYDAQKKQDINKALLSFSKLLQDAQNNPNQLNKLRQLASQIAPQNPLQTAPVMAGETVDQEAAPVAAPAAAPVAAADGTRFKQKKVRTAMDSKL
jgi:ribosome-binding ATPase YchF (GTP1/OBG family)